MANEKNQKSEAQPSAEELQKQLEEANKLNQELLEHQEQLDAEKKIGRPTIKIDKKLYEMPFEEMYPNKELRNEFKCKSICRQDVIDNKKLQAALLKMKSGFLVPIN